MPSEFRAVVFAYLAGELKAVPAGQLIVVEEGLRILSTRFGYGAKYLERSKAISIDAASLELQGAVPGTEALREPTHGLEFFGAIRDAMPDMWGRRVIENRLKAPPNSLPETRYLMEAGSNRFGALDIREGLGSEEDKGLLVPVADLQYLLDAADKIQQGEPVPHELGQLFQAGPSMGGARPKAVVVRDKKQYLAKFPAIDDRFNIPAVERATLELARVCGLAVPETDLIRLPDGRQAMLIERFDRYASGSGFARRHAISALTALELHEAESSKAAYADIALKISDIGAQGRVQADRSELFGRMVFNILVSNDDDHLRNHAFIGQPDEQGWGLSPLYDVLPKPQVSQTRYLHLGVGTEGRLATLPNALSKAALFGLQDGQAREIVERIARSVREWRTHFDEFDVKPKDMEIAAAAIRHPRDVGWQ
jgi:serine/threonine-protein kinase HipA